MIGVVMDVEQKLFITPHQEVALLEPVPNRHLHHPWLVGATVDWTALALVITNSLYWKIAIYPVFLLKTELPSVLFHTKRFLLGNLYHRSQHNLKICQM